MRLKGWLSRLSFRHGVTVGLVSLVCYALSFAQALLPISVTTKWVLWVVLFGMAKTAQYTALLILGAEGVRRIRQTFSSRYR